MRHATPICGSPPPGVTTKLCVLDLSPLFRRSVVVEDSQAYRSAPRRCFREALTGNRRACRALVGQTPQCSMQRCCADYAARGEFAAPASLGVLFHVRRESPPLAPSSKTSLGIAPSQYIRRLRNLLIPIARPLQQPRERWRVGESRSRLAGNPRNPLGAPGVRQALLQKPVRYWLPRREFRNAHAFPRLTSPRPSMSSFKTGIGLGSKQARK